MSGSPPLIASTNPGLPGFVHFWVWRFARSSELALKARKPVVHRTTSENFPAGNLGVLLVLEGLSEPSALAIRTFNFRRTFLQESFSLRPFEGTYPLRTLARTGGFAMPPM